MHRTIVRPLQEGRGGILRILLRVQSGLLQLLFDMLREPIAAMTTMPDVATAVRIGVIWRGRAPIDIVLSMGGSIHIGSAETNDIVIDPKFGLRSHLLLENGRWLHVLPEMLVYAHVDLGPGRPLILSIGDGTFADLCKRNTCLASPIRLAGERAGVRLPHPDGQLSIFVGFVPQPPPTSCLGPR
jgi:hypothetical protein